MPAVGISLNRSTVDYGEIEPGESSGVVEVRVTNTGSRKAAVTLEIRGSDQTAQRFYERSLYINNLAYNPGSVITSIEKAQSMNLNTQLKVPTDWYAIGRQDAVLVFWAEAADQP
jgi:ribosomal protein S18 acetylase RimI-like enzyme